MTPNELDAISYQLFYKWAKEDGTLDVDNLAHPEKIEPFVPEPYVSNR